MKPILRTTSNQLQSKPNPKESTLENLTKIFKEVRTLANKVAKRGEATAHLESRTKLKTILEETGLDLSSLEMMERLALREQAKTISQKIRKKSEVTLTRELLALIANLPNIRANAHTYGEAWPELEGEFCLKISLYRMEKAIRESQKQPA